MMTMTATTVSTARRALTGRLHSADPTARAWAPIWVRPSEAGPSARRRSPVATFGLGTVQWAGAAAPVRLDEATRRLLRVPSLVAETAVRLGAGAARDDDVDAPARPGRRRVRRPHSRRPPSGLVRVSPQFGVGGGCDLASGRAVTQAYRMSRRARLSLTLTVVAAVVVLAAHALLSGDPSGTTSVTVVAGDTLWSIAQRSAPDTEVWSVIDEISALNGLTGSDISAGQVLVVPVG